MCIYVWVDWPRANIQEITQQAGAGVYQMQFVHSMQTPSQLVRQTDRDWHACPFFRFVRQAGYVLMLMMLLF